MCRKILCEQAVVLNNTNRFNTSLTAIVKVKNIDALKKMIRVIAITSSQIGSKSTTATDTTKQEQVEKEIGQVAADTQGAETAAAPKAPGSDDYDEWD